MKYQAMTTFEGILAMKRGEVKELDPNSQIVKDLTAVGWLKEFKVEKKDKEDGK